ncbi:MAG TPA: prepilin-type N-terminal cleavage/methylation domain-containing protein, partial [Verrucomicrobiae bacterium]|nr:prepilin-type N-terminal cleavage/methylation domain-containing protein [Verrucomicrobiae bacterium]
MNAKHTSRASLRTAGFSLIEILIVVAIGFIMAAVAIPQALGAYRTY